MDRAAATPPDVHTLTPFLFVQDAGAAADFYVSAFGGVEVHRERSADGSVRHAQVQLGDSRIMISGAVPAHSPAVLGGSGVHFYFHVEDVDAALAAAVAAGGEIVTPAADEPWGDRVGALKDPFGHTWYVASRRADV